MPFRISCALTLACVGWSLWVGASVTAPVVLSDLMIRGTARPAIGASVVGARCTSVDVILHVCRMTIVTAPADGGMRRAVIYAMVFPHAGPFPVHVLVDPDHPDWPTTDLGLAYLADRAIGLLLFMPVATLVAAFALLGMVGLIRPAAVRTR